MTVEVKTQYEEIWQEAIEAGNKAVEECKPRPMVVQEVDLDDKPYPGSKSWFVADGPCGFAWIIVKPGNSSFARWLKENDLARPDSYYGGVSIWATVGNQSIQKKEAWAKAVADVLVNHGIRAVWSSRLD